MARKRMIDPGVWESEQVQELTPYQFKLYIYLISTADDEGRFKANPAMIAAACFPLDEEYQSGNCTQDLREMDRIGLVKLYEVGGRQYGHHPNWDTYQYIQRKQTSKIPSPPQSVTGPVPEEYDTSIVQVTDDDVNDTGEVSPNRIEKKRIEGNTSMSADALEGPDPPVPSKPEKPAPMKDPLAQRWEDALTEIQPSSTWGNWGKERSQCKVLASRTRELLAQTPYETSEEVISAVLAEYRQLKSLGRSDYWVSAPWTPSALIARWPAVWESLAKQHEERGALAF